MVSKNRSGGTGSKPRSHAVRDKKMLWYPNTLNDRMMKDLNMG
jgi:hypothetical protein